MFAINFYNIMFFQCLCYFYNLGNAMLANFDDVSLRITTITSAILHTKLTKIIYM